MGTTDGLDFANLAANPSGSWRTNFLIEHGGTTSGGAASGLTYCGVRTQNYIVCPVLERLRGAVRPEPRTRTN